MGDHETEKLPKNLIVKNNYKIEKDWNATSKRYRNNLNLQEIMPFDPRIGRTASWFFQFSISQLKNILTA